MAKITTAFLDPTLKAIDALIELDNKSNSRPRPYLGASQIGEFCSRKIWLNFRWALNRFIPASGLRRIADGFRGEQVLVDWLRAVPGVELWTEDPEHPEQQIGMIDCGGHFCGHLDGVIQGLKQAPKTPHVWEAKVCNEAKVTKLRKLIAEKGEKAALKAWDEVYYAQAQVYMRGVALTRHYLTVATPGVRDIVSCRTEYAPKDAEALVQKAQTIITADRPPLKISETPAWYQCKFCDHADLCHGTALPHVNCRTCAHSTATLQGNAHWQCEHHHHDLDEATQRAACPSHVWHPDLLENHAEAVGANPKTGAITFKRKDGTTVEIGMGGVFSRSLLADSAPPPAPEKDDVLEEFAAESALPTDALMTGQLEESDFPAIVDAASRFWSRWQHDASRMARLRALLEVIDTTYLQVVETRVMREMSVA